MMGKGKLDLVERLTNECIDLCQTVLRRRKRLEPLLDPAFRTQKLLRAVNEQKTAVNEMEAAVDRIIAAVERMSEIDFSDAAAAEQQLSACCDEIMEACCFQDLTGQRMSQVNDTLNEVEAVLASIADGRASPQVSVAGESLLNGPALPGNGVEQDVVDRLLATSEGRR